MTRTLMALVIGGLLAAAPAAPVLANQDSSMGGPMYHRTSYRGAPDLNLALAVVLAGGGPKVNANFHTILTTAVLDLKDAYGL
jgi:hypothetical protein